MLRRAAADIIAKVFDLHKKRKQLIKKIELLEVELKWAKDDIYEIERLVEDYWKVLESVDTYKGIEKQG
jgi:hypothetical protein